MRLISEVEANLVSGGSFLVSDSFDASNGGGYAYGSPVYVSAQSSSGGPDWTEFGAGVAALAFAAGLALAAPATALVTIAVVVSSYWGGVIVSDSFQDGANFKN